MKKIITFIALTVLSVSAYAQATANCIQLIQRNEADNGAYIRYACPPASGDGMLVQDAAANLPTQLKIGPGLLRTGDTLSAPSPDLSGYASSSALSAGLSTKFNIPSGSVSEYLRGDGSRATFPTIPSATPFAFGAPAAKTVAVSTAYQATDITKAAVVTLNPACTNATTLLAASACTLQIRQSSAAGLTCSTGTVVSTWTSTIALGLVITQGNGFPIDVKLPAGGYFIICPSAGTFTISAVEQSAG